MQQRQQNDSKEWKGKVECKKPQCMKVKMRKKTFSVAKENEILPRDSSIATTTNKMKYEF